MRFVLRFHVLLWVAFGVGAYARAAEPPAAALDRVPAPLRSAVEKVGADANRWAYTQHLISRDRKGQIKEETVARFDPSRHYDEQWTLLRRDGREATEPQIRKFRREREKLAKKRKPFGELLDLDKARLVASPETTPETLIYEVPLRLEESSRLPADKMQVRVSVSRERETLERIDVTLTGPVRAMMVAKIKEGTVALVFRSVRDDFAPALTEIRFAARATVAFMPVAQRTEITRTDFERVKPFDERFQVKLAPLQTIDF